MRVALVHDYLIQYGGAERVLEEFSNIFPNAPIYTLLYDSAATGYAFENRDVRPSFLQKIPGASSRHKLFPLFMPYAIESIDLSGYDLILSSSASFAKGAIVRGDGIHFSYCHSPMRYAWSDFKKITGDSMYPSLLTRFIPFLMPYMRIWDRNSAQRPDYIICNSNYIKKKIKKFYDRKAEVIYPPLNFDKFQIRKPRNYFLMVGRMVPYKRFDLAIEAFNELGLPLKIIGDGPEFKKLRNIARENIEFMGLVSEKDLRKYYSEAQALIFPQEEDFGIVALESMASGRPVIAYGAGGATESIRDGESGIFFYEQTPENLAMAVKKFKMQEFDPKKIRDSVEKFNKNHFRENIKDYIEEKWREANKLILA